MNYIVKAIRKLKPSAEFSLIADDYLSTKWDVLEGDAPTQEEINQTIEIIKKEELEAKKEAVAKKAAAEAKLAALGLTADDLKALGLA